MKGLMSVNADLDTYSVKESVARPSIPPLRSNLSIYPLFVGLDFVDKCLSAISQRNSAFSSRLPTTRFLSPEHSVDEEESVSDQAFEAAHSVDVVQSVLSVEFHSLMKRERRIHLIHNNSTSSTNRCSPYLALRIWSLFKKNKARRQASAFEFSYSINAILLTVWSHELVASP
ncbi:4-hydroxy-2-ketovalerate aldolase [Striga asiatica]|uniref:4-hydroxy-2-ketovalerate aldolase n=1 Tax=Striga asiatica TaxID=4170 RepID=A0A5A7Q011_STRAF|nr:4-hydroxy-2-ketovalerate aldolase [Striga asiatica]